ncbi:MAG: tetratricopeptide repeat protein [Polyangiaceae bacterium]|nr:tetratricopeptide repeat protein [Polyangiaceae bacterium]
MTNDGPISSETSAPVLLLVGATPSLKDGLVEALTRRGVYVETVPVESVQKAVTVTAPDIVVLADGAVQDGGSRVLDELGSSPLTSLVPVAILCEEPSLEQRLEAFRRGAAAVVPRLPSMDGMAAALIELAQEIPERSSQRPGGLGESTLRDFTEALSHQLRARLLVQVPSSPDKEVRLVFGGGRPLARLVDDFVQQLEHHVVHAESLAPDARIELGPDRDLLNEAELQLGDLSLTGMRVALADDDVARADVVAQDLRVRGATVLVTDLSPSQPRFGRLRRLDPNVLIVGEEQLSGIGYGLVRRAHSDSRLRWTTLLVVQWEQVCPDPGQPFALDQLAARLVSMTGAEQQLRRRVLEGDNFDTRLEITGPARLLYALADSPTPLRVTVQTPRARVELDVSDNLIVGATASRIPSIDERLQGPAALAALLTLSGGRVRVMPVARPAAANIMAAVDMALDLADKELEAGRVLSFSVRPEPRIPSVAPVGATAALPPVAASPPPVAAALPEETAALPEESAALRDARAALPPPLPVLAGGSRAPAIVEEPTSPAPVPMIEAPAGQTDSEPVASDEPVTASTSTDNASPQRPPLARWLATLSVRFNGLSRHLRMSQLSRHLRIDAWPRTLQINVALGVLIGLLAVALVAILLGGRSAPPEAAPAPTGPTAAAPPTAPTKAPDDAGRAALDLKRALPPADNPAAPSCDELLKGAAPVQGPSAALSYQLMLQGRRALVRGDVNAAQRAYCSSLRFDPGNAAAQAEFARLLLIRRDGNAGLRQVETALELDPGSRVLKGLLGDALARLGRYEEARRAWHEEAQLAVDSEGAGRALLLSLARAARRHRGHHAWGEAERFFRRVAVLEPGNVDAALGIAQALLSLSVNEEARAWARYARSLSPHHPQAAELLRRLGDRN